MGSIDARFSGSIYRKNWNQVIATDRHLAKIAGVRVAWQSSQVIAGTVLGRVTATGFYKPYNDSNSDGSQTAVGVTLDDIDFEAASGASGIGTQAARLCYGGVVYKDNLTGLDSAAETDLKAREIVDASGTTLLSF